MLDLGGGRRWKGRREVPVLGLEKRGKGERGGTPHKKFGSIPPALGVNRAVGFGMGDGFGPGERDQVLVWGAERGRMRVGTPQKNWDTLMLDLIGEGTVDEAFWEGGPLKKPLGVPPNVGFGVRSEFWGRFLGSLPKIKGRKAKWGGTGDNLGRLWMIWGARVILGGPG